MERNENSPGLNMLLKLAIVLETMLDEPVRASPAPRKRMIKVRNGRRLIRQRSHPNMIE